MKKLFLILGVFISPFGHTQTFTCGRDFAQIGDAKSVVESKCGAPSSKDSFCKKEQPTQFLNHSPGGSGTNIQSCENIEEWTYRPGIGQFVTFIQFKEGRLSEIKYGPRM
jgi:hypothetical protein